MSSETLTLTRKSPWVFVPSLYFTEALPYCIIMMLSGLFYKNSGISNSQLALWTSGFYLPWVLKPLWSPYLEMWGSKRRWIVGTQLALSLGFLALAASLHSEYFFLTSVLLFWLLALLSATHDIAADGFYVLGLSSHQQAYFVGIRSTCFRLGLLFGQGALVMWVGHLEQRWDSVSLAWSALFGFVAVLFALSALWHSVGLPRPIEELPKVRPSWWRVFRSFFEQAEARWIVFFLLTYRLGEGQLLKLGGPFFLDGLEAGGLGLTTSSVGWLYGVAGVVALVSGGLLGGWLVSRQGLKKLILPMWACLNLPNLLYAWLAIQQPVGEGAVLSVVLVEQFGYGIGFTGYMMVMLYAAGQGEFKVAHYALTTGFMALGMMLPGMVSGWIQEQLGYTLFFCWVAACALPPLLAIRKISIPSDFGCVDDAAM